MGAEHMKIWLEIAAAVLVIGTAVFGGLKLLTAIYIRRHTMPMTREKAKEIHLDEYLKHEHLGLVWRHADTVDQDVQHHGYQRIKWKDPRSGKVWRLVGDPHEDFPLAQKRG